MAFRRANAPGLRRATAAKPFGLPPVPERPSQSALAIHVPRGFRTWMRPASLFCRSPPPYGAQLSLPPHQRAGPYSDVSQSGVSLPLSGLTVLLAPWACVPASPFTPSRRRSSHIPVTLSPAAFVQVPGYAVFKVRLSGFLLPLTYTSREGVKYKALTKFP